MQGQSRSRSPVVPRNDGTERRRSQSLPPLSRRPAAGPQSQHNVSAHLHTRSPNWSKIHQVLDYSYSLEKASKLFGVDMEQVKDVKRSQLEYELLVERSLDTGNGKRGATKALEVLGHNPSEEKVKKTLGIDDDDVEKAKLENVEHEEERLSKKRAIATPYNKRQSAKALSTLGFDPSLHRSMKLLGIEENTLRKALSEENLRSELKIQNSRKNLGSRNRKENKKALTVIGHDPSKEKVIHQLGSEAKRDIDYYFGNVTDDADDLNCVNKLSPKYWLH